MIDQSTAKGRIVAAALRLAAERPWRDVSLADIADAANINLAELRREVSGKSDILAAFARMVDDEVLAKAPKRPAGQAARDAVFEIVMNRFDAMAPHRSALRSIMDAPGADLALVQSYLSSQAWMLNAAGVTTDGIEGNARVLGLASIYGSVLRTWLDDDDPGLARTMAVLDRRLRRGESTARTVEDAIGAARRVTGMLWEAVGNRRRNDGGDGSKATPAGGGAGSPT